MKRIAKIAISLIALTLMVEADALACTCKGKADVTESFRDANAVFMGRVIEYGENDVIAGATFKVESSWKGVNTNRIAVITPANSCGVRFKEGENYIVYANSFSGDLSVNVCSRIVPVIEANEEIADLRGRQTLPLASISRSEWEVTVITAISVLLFLALGVLWKRVAKRAA